MASGKKIYDLRTGASIGLAIEIENLATSSTGLTFLIQSSNFASQKDDLSDIPESSWKELEPEATLTADTKSAVFEFFRATPAITAVRIRLKAATAANVDVKGIVGWF